MNGWEIKRHGYHLTFKFNERDELFVGAHNETLSVAMCVCNPDGSPVGITG
jgi:hypothetical protein